MSNVQNISGSAGKGLDSLEVPTNSVDVARIFYGDDPSDDIVVMKYVGRTPCGKRLLHHKEFTLYNEREADEFEGTLPERLAHILDNSLVENNHILHFTQEQNEGESIEETLERVERQKQSIEDVVQHTALSSAELLRNLFEHTNPCYVTGHFYLFEDRITVTFQHFGEEFDIVKAIANRKPLEAFQKRGYGSRIIAGLTDVAATTEMSRNYWITVMRDTEYDL